MEKNDHIQIQFKNQFYWIIVLFLLNLIYLVVFLILLNSDCGTIVQVIYFISGLGVFITSTVLVFVIIFSDFKGFAQFISIFSFIIISVGLILVISLGLSKITISVSLLSVNFILFVFYAFHNVKSIKKIDFSNINRKSIQKLFHTIMDRITILNVLIIALCISTVVILGLSLSLNTENYTNFGFVNLEENRTLLVNETNQIDVFIQNEEGKDLNYSIGIFLNSSLVHSVFVFVQNTQKEIMNLYIIPERIMDCIAISFFLNAYIEHVWQFIAKIYFWVNCTG